MMNIQPSELGALLWWEYQGVLWNWNDRQPGSEAGEVEPPEMNDVLLHFAKIERAGLARTVH
jgi:hypothetical protein